ncbi:MAG: PAQR family membrane homeostasis protein TrhA [Thermoleophilia bacterium]
MGSTAQTLHAKRSYSLGEEIANSVIHGVGAGLSAAALALLVTFAVQASDGWKLAGAIVFGVTLLLEFAASTLYHSFPQPRVKHVFKVLDHAGIYLLIAGTYTPFIVVILRESGYWWMLAVVWTMALIGIVAEAFWVYRPKWVSVVVYLTMGWLVVVAIRPLAAHLAEPGVWLLAAGGLAYTLGTIFYVLKQVRYTHAVWHLFVLGGAVCHFLVVALYVI